MCVRMLAEEREDKCSKHLQVCKQHHSGILQNGVMENSLHLLYADSVLTVRRDSLLHHAVKLNSALHFITEFQAVVSSINFTFDTLSHLSFTSLASPKRPLMLPKSQSPPSSNGKVKVSRKIHSQPNGEERITVTTSGGRVGGIQEPSRKAPKPRVLPPPVKHDRSHWLTRRHSFCVPNSAPPKQPQATGNSRVPVRRNSVGLVPPPGTAFPATMMYSKMVSHMEHTLESSRHFYHLQRFSNCFFGHSMVNCLLAYCVAFLNSNITKDQATEMCKRLLAQGVIENVSHLKQQDMEGTVFKSSRLYRFTGNHFWEDYMASELDGPTSSTSMPSLSPGPRRSNIKRVCSSLRERKRGLVRSCKSRLSFRDTSNTL